MRIALIGYGKMGKAIEEVALLRGHDIVLKIDQPNLHDFTKENMAKADVAIEFTSPHTAFDNIKSCIEFGVPVVCGSTGWTDKLEEMKKNCMDKSGSFIYSSNYSVGVNIFFEINKKLAVLMASHKEYEIILEETIIPKKKMPRAERQYHLQNRYWNG